MGLFSKLFKSDTKGTGSAAPPEDRSGAERRPSDADHANAVSAQLPTGRATPTDVHDRPTVPKMEALVAEERPTVVMPIAMEVLAAETATSPSSLPPPPTAPTSKRAKPPPLPPRRKPAPPPVKRASIPAADDFDSSFAALEVPDSEPRVSQPGLFQVDMTEVQRLFGELATNHMRQVRDFIIELRWGPTPTTWIAVCEPSVESLCRAATNLDFTALADKLRAFAKATQLESLGGGVTTIEGGWREAILAAHGELEKLLPETFALDGDRSLREAAILHSLLSQIPDVGKVTIDKLYAAGLTTLETMLLATASDLVATTGIAEILADRIVQRFRLYRAEMASVAVDETRATERAKIAALVDTLRKENTEFAEASAGWTEDALQRKKDILLARTQTMLEIDLQLARLGEIAIVRELERLPFARKVARLDAFLAKAREMYGA